MAIFYIETKIRTPNGDRLLWGQSPAGEPVSYSEIEELFEREFGENFTRMDLNYGVLGCYGSEWRICVLTDRQHASISFSSLYNHIVEIEKLRRKFDVNWAKEGF